MNPWKCFEALPGLAAVPAVWQRRMGEHYQAFRSICLEPDNWLVESYPCPRKCGCWHHVILRHDHTAAVGACQCQTPGCPDLNLTIADITPLKLNWTRLGRELCRAFNLTSRFTKLPPYCTHQIGTWSTDAVPAILTIQVRRYDFMAVVAQLAALMRRPFILFAPSSVQIDAHCQAMLENCGAAFYALDSHINISSDGTLHPIRPPAELFARFSPESERTPPPAAPPRYALRKGHGVWELFFDGQRALLKHERGIFYVHWLLYHPDETPIHALDLMAKIPEIYRQQLGLPALADPSTGKVAPLPSGARIQERSLALDDAQAMRALFKKEKELEAILDDESESEPVKAEALRELEAILEFQRQHGSRSADSARRAAHAARSAVARFHQHIASTVGEDGGPHPVLRSFADHIDKHILIPSARYAGHGGPHARAGLAGCFTYERPSGVSWQL